MRIISTILMLLLVAPALGAQTVAPQGTPQRAAVAEREAPVPEVHSAADAVAPPVAEAGALSEHAEARAEAAEPIFDRGFWRSVLAGVIASVLTAVILRVIL